MWSSITAFGSDVVVFQIFVDVVVQFQSKSRSSRFSAVLSDVVVKHRPQDDVTQVLRAYVTRYLAALPNKIWANELKLERDSDQWLIWVAFKFQLRISNGLGERLLETQPMATTSLWHI